MLSGELRLPHTGVSAVRIRGDALISGSCGWDGKLRVFDYLRKSPLAVLPAHSGACYSMDFAGIRGDSGLLSTGGKDGHVVVYSLYPSAEAAK